MIKKVLMENVDYTQEQVRHTGADLDINYFNTLTDEQKATYSASFEPVENDKYNFVAKHKN